MSFKIHKRLISQVLFFEQNIQNSTHHVLLNLYLESRHNLQESNMLVTTFILVELSNINLSLFQSPSSAHYCICLLVYAWKGNFTGRCCGNCQLILAFQVRMGSGLEFIRQSIFNFEFDYLYSSMVILCSQLTVVTHTMKNRSTYSCYQHILKTIFYITYIIDKNCF